MLVVRPLSSISTDVAFGEGLKMGIPHLNIYVLFSWSFLEPQLTLYSLSLMIRNFSVVIWLKLKARIHIFLTHFYFFKSIIEVFSNFLSQSEAVNELKANFICREATRVSIN